MNDYLLQPAWSRRRVVVLGANGFIGRHLVARLRDLAAQVTAGVFHECDPALRALWDGVHICRGDVRDEAFLESVVQDTEVVFALAGNSGAALSNRAPGRDLEVNGGGIIRLLEACRTRAPKARVIFPSSRLVYDRCVALPVAETHATKPRSVYGVHKLLGESYLALYRDLYGISGVTLRVTNPYGPDSERRIFTHGVINQFLRLARRGEAISIFGDGSQLRDYIHIEDVVDAMLICGLHPSADGGVFNLGTGEGTKLSSVAEMIVRLVGRGRVSYVPWPADQLLVETGDFYADVSKLERVLGWRPKTKLPEGLAGLASQMAT